MAYKVTGKLGSGARFEHLTKALKAKGAENPEALSAWVGMRKYGKKRMLKMAKAGRQD